jgi:predicted nucleic acid-binding protein
MILVDTSVWIDYFRNRENIAVNLLVKILDSCQPFAITGVIYQELLQDAANDKESKLLGDYLVKQHFLHPINPLQTQREAARLFYLCRRQGITPRSAMDCLIAQTAIEFNVPLLHNDKDYSNLVQVAPNLLLLP